LLILIFHILHLSTVRGRLRQRETRVQVFESPPLTLLESGAMETSLLKPVYLTLPNGKAPPPYI